MDEISNVKQRPVHQVEIIPKSLSGMPILLLNILMMLAAIAALVLGIMKIDAGGDTTIGVTLIVAGSIYLSIIGPIIFIGLKILKPNEALVLTLFGRYYGTLRGDGFFFVNPFVAAVKPGAATFMPSSLISVAVSKEKAQAAATAAPDKKISLKAITLNNDKQKINDLLGNPIIIGIVVIWRVVNTAKAVFNVDDFKEFLSIQSDSALRNIVRNYPYDTPGNDSEMSLRGSSQEVADKIKKEIQEKVEIAGLEVMEARITNLSYAPEIAAAMLQRQQASAIIDARQMIVEGAVGMVQMALDRLNENDIVKLDEERKAAMVSNLLVVLCGNRDVQPVVNSGSLY
ncbi:MAG TPA: SPFH domain-containing protein [Candidatus Limnocylindrales bacterium]|nr:SPFH domain-containing protein [Candidatus Limnocylindrales bacterium]